MVFQTVIERKLPECPAPPFTFSFLIFFPRLWTPPTPLLLTNPGRVAMQDGHDCLRAVFEWCHKCCLFVIWARVCVCLSVYIHDRNCVHIWFSKFSLNTNPSVTIFNGTRNLWTRLSVTREKESLCKNHSSQKHCSCVFCYSSTLWLKWKHDDYQVIIQVDQYVE